MAGTIVLVRRRRVVWPLLATYVLVVVTTAVTYGNQRFRMAAEPATVVLAAVALVWVGAAVRARRRARALSSGQRPLPSPRAG
jgi:hypothetical protein